MHYKLIIKGIRAIIPGGISDLDFSTASEIDELSAKELLHIFLQNGIGVLDGNIVNFQNTDKIAASIFAMKHGASIEDVSEFLNWKDFESLVSHVLEENGFQVHKNLILTKPRMEIDVVGIKLGMPVLSKGNLVGRIVEVNYISSRILLLNDLNSKIPAVISPSGICFKACSIILTDSLIS